VEENLLYVDDDQVHEKQNLDEGEGAHLHHDVEEFANLHHDGGHHDQEADELNDNERWAWMQAEVERISTEQQRQGIKLSGLWNDVQRGNRLTQENNEMLRRMMQHLHLHGPP
jgi:glucokinase